MRQTPLAWFALLFLFNLSLWCGEVRAGGFSNPDMGGRRMGMMSVVGKPDDVTAIFHNPAGMILLDGTNFFHSQSWFFVDLGIRMYDSEGVLHPDYEIKPDWNIGFLPFLGVTTDLGTERLRLGLAVYAPNAYGAAMSENEPVKYHATKALFLASRASLSAAWRFSRKLTVAAGVDLVHVFLWARRFMNPMVLANPDNRFLDPDLLAPSDAELTIEGQDLTWSLNFGILLQPTNKLSLGFTFNGGSDINLEGDVKLVEANGTVTKTTQHTDFLIPFTLRAGINWEFAPNFEWGFDLFFWHYQALQEQLSLLDDPVMGMTEFRDPKNYGNSWAWNTGLLYRLTPTFEVMVGYQRDYTPIPTQTFTLDNPTRNGRGASVGTRWQVSRKVRVSLAIMRNWYDLAEVQDSVSIPPSNIKGHGSNFEVGFDVNYRL